MRQPRARVLGETLTAAAVATGLAWTGVRVSCARPDPEVIGAERFLPEILRCLHRTGSVQFTEIADPDAVFVCGAEDVGAPPAASVVINCGLPPWTSTRALQERLGRAVVSNPQQLREGFALEDFLSPACEVLGADDAKTLLSADAVLGGLPSSPLHCDVDSADLMIPATNGLCAVEREFFEELTEFCGAVGADPDRVVECVRADPRIGVAQREPRVGEGEGITSESLRQAPAPPVLAELEALSH